MKETRKHEKRIVLGTIFALVLFVGIAGAEYAYISDWGDGNISVINMVTNSVTDTINVGGQPFAVAIGPGGNTVYVTDNRNKDIVSVIDATTNNVTATINVGARPEGVVVNPSGTKLYVANYNDSSVSVVDLTKNTVNSTVKLGGHPFGIAIDQAGMNVYVTSADNVTSVIDTTTDTIKAAVKVGAYPEEVAVNPKGNRIYVANYVSNNVSVINTVTNTVKATVNVGNGPTGIAVNPKGTLVYVSNDLDNTVSVIDTVTNTVKTTVNVGSEPYGISVRPDGNYVYVANFGSNNVSVIDAATNTVITSINVGDKPTAFGQFVDPPLTLKDAKDFNLALSINSQAATKLGKWFNKQGYNKSKELVINWLKTNKNVQEVALSPGGDTINIRYKSGFETAIFVGENGTLNVPDAPISGSAFDIGVENVVPGDVLYSDASDYIYNKYINPHMQIIGGQEESTSDCRKANVPPPNICFLFPFVSASYMKGSQITLDSIARGETGGLRPNIEFIDTHGGIGFNDTILILTGQHADVVNVNGQWMYTSSGVYTWLAQRHMILPVTFFNKGVNFWLPDSYWTFTPNYIRTNFLPPTRHTNYAEYLVYINACHSFDNEAMYDAYHARGIDAYVGWQGQVMEPFAQSTARNIFDGLYASPGATLSSIVGGTGITDPSSGATLKYKDERRFMLPKVSFASNIGG
jgi:YVTN family beta-propeller protein